MRNSSNQDLDAYCAGFFDGEGCIAIRKRKNVYMIQLSAYNTVRDPLLMFVRCYGGKVRDVKKRVNRKQAYAWYTSNKAVALFALAKMLPWLRVKKRKAQCAISMLRVFPSGSGTHPSKRVLGQVKYLAARYSDVL